MKKLPLILYATIKNFELAERVRREELTFDAFAFLAAKIGHKNPSTLRKMCQPTGNGGGAKLGVHEAAIIMDVTGDYRLLQYLKEELAALKRERTEQIDLFANPLRTIDSSEPST